MIWEELENNLVHISVDATTMEEVMQKVGKTFVDTGYCKETFIEALIAREKEFPTGLDIDGIGVAIPHTDISHVNRAAVAVATLKKSVTFVQMGTDDEFAQVRLVFMLAIDNPDAHLDKLEAIVAIIQDREILEKLLKSKNKIEIVEIIKAKELK